MSCDPAGGAHSVSRTSTPLRGRRTFRSVLTIAGSKGFELGLYFALCATLGSRPVPQSGTANHHAPCQIYLNPIGVPRAYTSD